MKLDLHFHFPDLIKPEHLDIDFAKRGIRDFRAARSRHNQAANSLRAIQGDLEQARRTAETLTGEIADRVKRIEELVERVEEVADDVGLPRSAVDILRRMEKSLAAENRQDALDRLAAPLDRIQTCVQSDIEQFQHRSAALLGAIESRLKRLEQEKAGMLPHERNQLQELARRLSNLKAGPKEPTP